MTSKSDDNGDDGRRREPEVEEAFSRLVSEGSNRLDRPLVPLLATGFVGGIDVGVGVLAYLVVYHETGQPLLAAAAFPIGFIALLLARSELFTENFLVPVTARIAGRGSWPQLVRLWLVTLAANLVGGLVMAGLIAVALPDLRSVAATLGHHYATLGISWRSLLLAVLAGIVITLLTRMQHASDDLGPKPGCRGTRRAELGLLLLLQQGVGELEQVRTGQHGQGIDGKPGRPRQVDVTRRQAGRDP